VRRGLKSIKLALDFLITCKSLLRDASNNVVPATITFSADFKTVTLQPNSNLTGGGVTYYFEIGYWAYLYDVGGNQLSYGYIQFTTH
jgi:Bacterial Ig-like domain